MRQKCYGFEILRQKLYDFETFHDFEILRQKCYDFEILKKTKLLSIYVLMFKNICA